MICTEGSIIYIFYYHKIPSDQKQSVVDGKYMSWWCLKWKCHQETMSKKMLEQDRWVSNKFTIRVDVFVNYRIFTKGLHPTIMHLWRRCIWRGGQNQVEGVSSKTTHKLSKLNALWLATWLCLHRLYWLGSIGHRSASAMRPSDMSNETFVPFTASIDPIILIGITSSVLF